MYAFIHIPKTGGSTLRHVLRCSFGASHCDIKVPPARRRDQDWILPRDVRIAKACYPRLAGICGHRVTCFNTLEVAGEPVRYFTFIRDPVQRFLSNYYHDQRDKGLPPSIESLRAFAASPGRRNMISRMLCGEEDGPLAIKQLEENEVFVGLTSRFEESYCMLRHWLGSKKLLSCYMVCNESPVGLRSARSVYVEQVEIAREANEEDIQVYDAVVGRIFPRQIKSYAGCLAGDVENLRKRNETTVMSSESLWAKGKRSYLYKPMLHILP